MKKETLEKNPKVPNNLIYKTHFFSFELLRNQTIEITSVKKS